MYVHVRLYLRVLVCVCSVFRKLCWIECVYHVMIKYTNFYGNPSTGMEVIDVLKVLKKLWVFCDRTPHFTPVGSLKRSFLVTFVMKFLNTGPRISVFRRTRSFYAFTSPSSAYISTTQLLLLPFRLKNKNKWRYASIRYEVLNKVLVQKMQE